MIEMLKSQHLLAVGLNYYTLATGFLLGPIVAAGRGLELAGVVYGLLAAQQLFGYFFTLGLNTYSIKSLSRDHKRVRRQRVVGLLVSYLFGLGLVLIFLSFGLDLVLGSNEFLGVNVFWMSLLVYGAVIRFFLEDLFLGAGRLVLSASISSIEASLRIILLGCIDIHGNEDVALFLFLSCLVPTLLMFPFLRVDFRPDLTILSARRFVETYMLQSLTLWGSHALGMMQARGPMLIVSASFSPVVLGIYGVITTLAEPALRLGTVLSRFILRWSAAGGSPSMFFLFLKKIIFLFFVLSIIELALFPMVVDQFFDFNHRDYNFIFVLLLMNSGAVLIINFLSSFLNGVGSSGFVLTTSGVVTVILFFSLLLAIIYESLFLIAMGVLVSNLIFIFMLGFGSGGFYRQFKDY